MKILDKEIKTNGTTYTQIQRDDFRAIYKSTEGYYEVFRIDVRPSQEVFGKILPEREIYPSNETFGITAICTKDWDKALKYYNNIKPKKIKNE